MIRSIIVDDMPKARSMLSTLLGDFPHVEILAGFDDAISAIAYLKENPVDLVFLDIEMPELGGLEAAKIISQLDNAPKIIFSTAFTQYSIQAWTTDAISYIVKPYSPQAIADAIEKYNHLYPVAQVTEPAVKISCFPIFNVFIDDVPVYFKNKKAKELLAFLVHNKGGWAENNDICYYVLDEMDEELAKNNLRTYVKRLKTTLEDAGISHIIEHQYGALRVNRNKFTCDYYQYIEGDTHLFLGEYLKEYAWAEPALALMLKNAGELL